MAVVADLGTTGGREHDLPRRVLVVAYPERAGLGEHRRRGAVCEVEPAIGSFKRPRPGRRHRHGMHALAAVALAAFLIVNGGAHFVRPDYVRRLVPVWLGRARLLVAVGGVALVADGVLLLVPGSRAAGGGIAAVLISVFVVAHIDGLVRAVAARPRRVRGVVGAAVEVLVNFAYTGWAVVVASAG
ncbi:hypothetical protein [Streptomyces thermodiastaticus]|uniref:hypothetical protein n=1 Tax=Streptomyces thermodiastaticus TaxID=44061 RepID=UPI001672C99D|nr:hypothetical protein [Streptomyces thermodiastaticus]MCE7553335.1 hypothetical protein [Streptomyces thermodiastaticus]